MDGDVVIVGAGAAGCVLANRLSADPSRRVVVLEQGDRRRHPWLEVPKAFARAITDPRFVTFHPTTPAVDGGPPGTWIRGRGPGGSTLVNGLLWVRGQPTDHDDLAAGDERWAWPAMLAAYRALEDHALGPSPLRGVGGPVPVSVAPVVGAVLPAMLAAAGASGLAVVDDVNGTGACIGPSPATIRRGRRVSAARAFLDPVAHRNNLVVIDGARALALVQDGDRVVGVRTRSTDGHEQVHRAGHEVILAAGTIGSPVLLERSGIGDPAVLAAAGIDVRVPLPGVGEGVVEQRAVTVKFRLRAGLGGNQHLSTPLALAGAAGRWLLTRDGPLGRPAYDLAARVATDGGGVPDAQVLLTDLSTDATGLAIEDAPGMMAVGYPLRPTTAGSIHVIAADPDTPPRIEAAFLATAADRAATVGILGWIRALASTDPLAELVVTETMPGPALADEDAVAHALATGDGIYHAVGSCARGPVVDGALRVRGVEGLRVIDASVHPAMPAGGTAAPTMALAWVASDLVLGSS